MNFDSLLAFPWPVWTILVPLVAALSAFLIPRLATLCGALVALLSPLLAAAVAWQLFSLGPQRYPVGGWPGFFSPHLFVDGLTAVMLLMAAVVGALITVYGLGYFRAGHGFHSGGTEKVFFWPLWLFLLAALNALFLAADAFNIYVTLELLALSAVPLAALSGAAGAIGAALRYFLVSLLGSLCYLLGVGLLYSKFATVDLATLAGLMTPVPAAWVALALMIAGLLLKTALFPLHFWLPPAHSSAPAPVSAALSALVVKASFYLLLRLWFDVFSGLATPALATLLGVLGSAAVIWGSLQACLQQRLKLLVAYSTVAQLGYLFLLFPLALGQAPFVAWSGGVLFALSHALGKSAMFLSAGCIMQATGHDRIADLAGYGQKLTLPLVVFALAAVSIIGLPPSGGFLAKWMLLNAALVSGQWWWVLVMMAGTMLAGGYILRVLAKAFLSAPGSAECHPVPAVMQYSALVLALMAFGLGLLAGHPVALLEVGAPLSGPPLAEVGR